MFFFGFFPPKRQSLNGDPMRAPSHLTLVVLEAGAGQAAAVTLLAPPPLPQGALRVIFVGPGEVVDAGSVAR